MAPLLIHLSLRLIFIELLLRPRHSFNADRIPVSQANTLDLQIRPLSLAQLNRLPAVQLVSGGRGQELGFVCGAVISTPPIHFGYNYVELYSLLKGFCSMDANSLLLIHSACFSA